MKYYNLRIKQILVTIILIFVTIVEAYAGNHSLMSKKNSVGIRIGGLSSELSYQRYINNLHRLEINTGVMYNRDGFIINGIYQFMMPINIDNFNWYLGAGVSTGAAEYFFMDGVGQIGLEYNLRIPLSFSIDWRPALRLAKKSYFESEGVAFSIRFRF